jgi:hypothetical protein
MRLELMVNLIYVLLCNITAFGENISNNNKQKGIYRPLFFIIVAKECK